MNNSNTIVIFLASIIALIVLGKVFFMPLKIITRLLINSIIGGLLIFLINWIGTFLNFHIGLNIVTTIFVRNSWYSRSNTFNNI